MSILKPKVLYQRHKQTSDMPILKPRVLYQRHKQTSDMSILKPKVLLNVTYLTYSTSSHGGHRATTVY
jgi:hypothetical protein